jgi:acetoin utilization protein AcuB
MEASIHACKRGPSMTKIHLVRDVMTTPVETIPRSECLLTAALILRRTGYRHLPIVEDGRLVGIITDRDIGRLSPSRLENISPEAYNTLLEETPLERVMTRDPLSATPDMPVVEAVALMHQKKLGCMPVVDGGQVVGIITVNDMLQLLHRLLGGGDEAGAG